MSVSLHVDPQSVARFQNQMKRFAAILNKDAPEALKVGTIYFCKSMAARTKIAPKKRKIVKNPNPRAGIDRRVAPLGVMRYRNGEKVFVPVYRFGEYGAQGRIVSKNGVDLKISNGKWQRFDVGKEFGQVSPSLLNDHPKRIIKNRGIAKRAWSWVVRDLYGRAADENNPKRPKNILFTNKGGAGYGAFVRFTNKLRYASVALKGSASAAMSEAFVAASHQIRNAVERALAKGGAK